MHNYSDTHRICRKWNIGQAVCDNARYTLVSPGRSATDMPECTFVSINRDNVVAMFDQQVSMPAIATWNINGEGDIRSCTPNSTETLFHKWRSRLYSRAGLRSRDLHLGAD